MVLLTHVAFNTGQVMQGWAGAVLSRFDFGVTLFFILSGFLLSRPFFMAQALGAPYPSTPHYLWKRALRILPLYWVVVIAALLLDPANRGSSVGRWISDLTLTQIYLDRAPSSSLTQMWSLATEASFYLVLPLLVALCAPRRSAAGIPATDGTALRRILLTLGVMSVVGLVWVGWAATRHTGPGFHSWLPAFLPWFGVGMAFAAISADLRVRPRPHVLDRLGADLTGCWLLATAVFAVACTAVAGPRSLNHPDPWEAVFKCVLYATAGAFFVLPLVFGPQRQGTVRRILTHPIPHYLGEISYGIFAIHMLVLVVGMEVVGIDTFTGQFWTVLGLVLVLTLPLSALAHRFVEKPLLRLKNAGPFAPRDTRRVADTAAP